MKRIIIFLIVAALVAIGIRACYMKDYVTVLQYSKDSSRVIISPDSIIIAPYLYVEDFNTLEAVIDFETLKDSLLLQDLNVTVHSEDNPDQSIKLRYVTAVIHPVVPKGDSPLDKLKVDNFSDLSLSEKTIRNSGLPYNKISFNFRTWQIRKTSFYIFRVRGRMLYKGKTFDFEKDIRAERKLEYRPYRMMT